MRVPNLLRGMATNRHTQRLADAIAARLTQPAHDEDHPPTSGGSTIELAAGRWMPHDHRPIIGFTPTSKETP